jgi:D-3-phosphoglycerate dehydrogenase
VVDEEGLMKLMGERDDLYYLSDIAPDTRDLFEDKYPDKVFFTPKKMGAQTSEANINAGLASANQIIGFLKNGDETFKVN